MRIAYSKEPQPKFQARVKLTVEDHDPFVTKQRVARTVHSRDMRFDDSDILTAVQEARNKQVASRDLTGSHEVRVKPKIAIERAAVTLGRFTLFVVDQKIPFELNVPTKPTPHVEPLPMEPVLREVV